MRMEIHPGDGGADAEKFAGELATAVGKSSGTKVSFAGRVAVLERL